MLKKILSLGLLVVSCYHGGPVTQPNIYLNQLYTRETAKATLEGVLNMEGVSFGTYPKCEIEKCVTDDAQFSCKMVCEGRSGNLNVQTDSTHTFIYNQIDYMECQGDEAFLYLMGETYEKGLFYKRPKPFILGEAPNCQKFIDALTYLKNH